MHEADNRKTTAAGNESRPFRWTRGFHSSITSITPQRFTRAARRRGPNRKEGGVAGGDSAHKPLIIKWVKTKRRQDDQSVLLVFITLESCCFTVHVQHGCFTTVQLTPNSIMSITGFRFRWFELPQLSYIYMFKKKKINTIHKKKQEINTDTVQNIHIYTFPSCTTKHEAATEARLDLFPFFNQSGVEPLEQTKRRRRGGGGGRFESFLRWPSSNTNSGGVRESEPLQRKPP